MLAVLVAGTKDGNGVGEQTWYGIPDKDEGDAESGLLLNFCFGWWFCYSLR